MKDKDSEIEDLAHSYKSRDVSHLGLRAESYTIPFVLFV